MAIASMTGFGRASGDATAPSGQSVAWLWEVKSVNGRGLDLKLRLPSGFDALDPLCRAAARSLERGSVQASLNLETASTSGAMTLDQDALRAVVQAVGAARLMTECTPPTADGLLSLRGVMRQDDGRLTPSDIDGMLPALMAGFEEALEALTQARGTEGARLCAVLSEKTDRMKGLTATAETHGPEIAAHLRAQLDQSLKAVAADHSVDPDRLATEVALLLVKTDVAEEVDRLKIHLDEAAALLAQGGVIGRKLDFLVQELQREASTLTTKAATPALNRIGRDLKILVDQFKEQAANIA